jgi:hypothetical protein
MIDASQAPVSSAARRPAISSHSRSSRNPRQPISFPRNTTAKISVVTTQHVDGSCAGGGCGNPSWCISADEVVAQNSGAPGDLVTPTC